MLLKAGKLSRFDSYRGIVRLGKGAMEELGLLPGDFVSIRGRKLTAAKVWRGKFEGILMDEVTARNAGLEGEWVEVEKVEVRPAKRILLKLVEFETEFWLLSAFGGLEGCVKELSKGRVVSRGELMAFGPKDLLEVLKTEPSGFVFVEKGTEVILSK